MTGPEGQQPARDDAVAGTDQGEFMPENEPTDDDDVDGDDGPYDGAEHVDVEDADGDDGPYKGALIINHDDIPEEETEEEILRGLTEAAGDELAGDDDDDVWLDEDTED